MAKFRATDLIFPRSFPVQSFGEKSSVWSVQSPELIAYKTALKELNVEFQSCGQKLSGRSCIRQYLRQL
ncbi:hypothetical protein QC763_0017940 [Podospora pseudopauciseta]|uniref:Uncharacterized protein n=2 Tax=Podospora TaxID=5144 RepID=A0ABR0I0C6_9PEZI|nr:hypothetical protein QC763_0017940 [Podospora pseudopauciseta]KAK4682315.1 hypothetical protein QC764_0017880 [Podospora pseudoanserina]